MHSLRAFHRGFDETFFPQFCKSCQCRLSVEEPVLCRVCTQKLEATPEENFLDGFPNNAHLDFAVALFLFDQTLQDVVHDIKYKSHTKSIFWLLEQAEERIQNICKRQEISAVEAVPLHHVRGRERGFNQSEVIKNAVLQITAIPAEKAFLRRVRYTQTQTKLDRDERVKNMERAFRALRPVRGRILLVDDVLTSGATTNVCAKVLKDAGAEWVGVLTMARPILLKEKH